MLVRYVVQKGKRAQAIARGYTASSWMDIKGVLGDIWLRNECVREGEPVLGSARPADIGSAKEEAATQDPRAATYRVPNPQTSVPDKERLPLLQWLRRQVPVMFTKDSRQYGIPNNEYVYKAGKEIAKIWIDDAEMKSVGETLARALGE